MVVRGKKSLKGAVIPAFQNFALGSFSFLLSFCAPFLFSFNILQLEKKKNLISELNKSRYDMFYLEVIEDRIVKWNRILSKGSFTLYPLLFPLFVCFLAFLLYIFLHVLTSAQLSTELVKKHLLYCQLYNEFFLFFFIVQIIINHMRMRFFTHTIIMP